MITVITTKSNTNFSSDIRYNRFCHFLQSRIFSRKKLLCSKDFTTEENNFAESVLDIAGLFFFKIIFSTSKCWTIVNLWTNGSKNSDFGIV